MSNKYYTLLHKILGKKKYLSKHYDFMKNSTLQGTLSWPHNPSPHGHGSKCNMKLGNPVAENWMEV